MAFPSGLLVQQCSVEKREGAKSKRLAGDLVETAVCQFVIKVFQRIGMKPRLKTSPADGSQYSPDAALEWFEGRIEHGIEDLMKRPIVVGRDDQTPFRLQDTGYLSQRLRQTHEPLGHTYQHHEIEGRIRKRQMVDLSYPRKNA